MKVVAAAADEAVKAFVQLMNPQAVRVVLPNLLAALDTKKNWQTKIAALQALSELCKRAPLQTNVCLPDIIPAVTSIMGDAKPQVKVQSLLTLQVPALSADSSVSGDVLLPADITMRVHVTQAIAQAACLLLLLLGQLSHIRKSIELTVVLLCCRLLARSL